MDYQPLLDELLKEHNLEFISITDKFFEENSKNGTPYDDYFIFLDPKKNRIVCNRKCCSDYTYENIMENYRRRYYYRFLIKRTTDFFVLGLLFTGVCIWAHQIYSIINYGF